MFISVHPSHPKTGERHGGSGDGWLAGKAKPRAGTLKINYFFLFSSTPNTCSTSAIKSFKSRISSPKSKLLRENETTF